MYLKDKTKRIEFRLSADDYEELSFLADNNGVTVSFLVRLMVKKYLAYYNSEEEISNEH